jgi:hypothetical protein
MRSAPEPLAAPVMVAELYGEFAFHPEPDDPARSEDAYSLFHDRSAALGWLTPARPGAAGGVWGMNDAEVTPAQGPERPRVALFQVVRTHAAGNGVPIQAFMACVNQVVTRLGRVEVAAVQLLVPAESVGEGVMASRDGLRVAESVLAGASWFADASPSVRTAITATLDGGPDRTVRERADEIERWVGGIQQLADTDRQVFAPERLSLAEADQLLPAPMNFYRPDWPTSCQHCVTFFGSPAEWSLDAVGWLAAFFVDGASRNGVTGPVRLAVERSRAG